MTEPLSRDDLAAARAAFHLGSEEWAKNIDEIQTSGESFVRYGHATGVEVDAETQRARWLHLRRAGIGGSDAAAICGQSTYRSALQVYLEKIGALGDDDTDNERMFWGRKLEPIVAEVLSERTGVYLWQIRAMLQHPEHEWALASIDRGAAPTDEVLPELADRGVHGAGVAEIKTAGYFAGKDWADDTVPEAYICQGMHYLAVTGLDWLLYGCLIAGQRLAVRIVQRDDELISHLLTIEADFWQHVQEREPPPPDGSKATTDLLAHLWDVDPGSVMVLDPGKVDPLLEQRAAFAATERHAGDMKREVDNTLRWMIGEHEVAKTPDGRQLFTWRATKTGARRLHIPTPKEVTQ